jgi:hypothetical protein
MRVMCIRLSHTKQELVEPVWCTPSALRASSRASSIGKSRSSISSSGCALNAHSDMFLKVLSGISACTCMHILLPLCKQSAVVSHSYTSKAPHTLISFMMLLYTRMQSSHGESIAPNPNSDKTRIAHFLCALLSYHRGIRCCNGFTS